MKTAEQRPYGKLKIVSRYISYYLRARNKHGVHPPTVVHFATEVLSNAKKIRFKKIEKERKRLLDSKQEIDFIDYGKNGNIFRKKVSDIAKHSLKPKKYARLLAAVAQDKKAKSILEMGTSLGITTAYLAQTQDTSVQTMEGDSTVAGIAESIWGQLGLSNINCTMGDFEKHINTLAAKSYDLVYIDGNHKKEPTLRYFQTLLENATDETLFIFDDIHYSKSMEQAWEEIKIHPKVSTSIDVFFLGFVYINPSLTKQHFSIRY